MWSETDLTTARTLVGEWKRSLESRFPSTTTGGPSPVARKLEASLVNIEETIAKMEQAGKLRGEIDKLPEGVVKQHMSKALQQLEEEIGVDTGVCQGGGAASSSQAVQQGGETPWEIKVILQEGRGQKSLVIKELSPSTTVSQLKQNIMAQSGITASSLTISRHPSGQPLGGDDSMPIHSLSVRNRDCLLARAGEASRPTAPKVDMGEGAVALVVSKANRAGLTIQGPKDGLALAVHVLMMKEGFVPIAAEEPKGGNGPKGFAPPIRPIPETQLVPRNWNDDPTALTFKYQHPTRRGKEFQLTVLWMDANVLVELRDSSSPDPQSLTLLGPDHVDMSVAGPTEVTAALFKDDLSGLHQSLVQHLVQPILPQPPTAAPSSSLRTGPPQSPFGIPVPGPLGPIPVGGGFNGQRGGGFLPDFSGDLLPGGIAGPGGGNLMGPQHPMFTGERGGGYPGMPMPAPRFDPFGPMIPPSRGGPPLGGGDPNDPRSRYRAFGDPNPDHLPPPGTDHMFF